MINESKLKTMLFTIQLGLCDMSEAYNIRLWNNTDLIDIKQPPKGLDVDTLQAVVDSINDLVPD
jgi:hypothetical protein